jgi:hypothetical protein
VFLMRIIRLAKIVVRFDRLDDPVHRRLAESGDARGDYCEVGRDGSAEFIIESANPVWLRCHCLLHRWKVGMTRAAIEQPEVRSPSDRGSRRIYKGHSRGAHGDLRPPRVVTPSQGQLVAGAGDNDCRPPALDEAVGHEDEMAGLDRVP